MERFIRTDTAGVELLLNLFTYGIEAFVIPWDFCILCVDVYLLGLESLCDTHLRLCHFENGDANRTGIF